MGFRFLTEDILLLWPIRPLNACGAGLGIVPESDHCEAHTLAGARRQLLHLSAYEFNKIISVNVCFSYATYRIIFYY